jgi:hypothetical protein
MKHKRSSLKSRPAFRIGQKVSYERREIINTKIVGKRWVAYSDGTGIWKYQTEDGHEFTRSRFEP